MKEQLEQRLNGLREEFKSGQKMLADLDNRQAELRNTLLRISGAIQVIEEEIGKYDGRGNEELKPIEPGKMLDLKESDGEVQETSSVE